VAQHHDLLISAAEIVRVVDALQLSARASVATPANWPNNHENIGAKVSQTVLFRTVGLRYAVL
jgi:alkyl hydroperoxide reductase subunit AhpC